MRCMIDPCVKHNRSIQSKTFYFNSSNLQLISVTIDRIIIKGYLQVDYPLDSLWVINTLYLCQI